VLASSLRCADCYEVNVTKSPCFFERSGEAQAAGFCVFAQKFRQTGLMNGQFAAAEAVDLFLIDVDAQNFESQFSHARRMRGA
jgi:hypothetical protein